VNPQEANAQAHALLDRARALLDARWYSTKSTEGFPLTVRPPCGASQLVINQDGPGTFKVEVCKRDSNQGVTGQPSVSANLTGDALLMRLADYAKAYAKNRGVPYHDRVSWRENQDKIRREEYDALHAKQQEDNRAFTLVSVRGHQRAVAKKPADYTPESPE
jgi:hypothetical protein